MTQEEFEIRYGKPATGGLTKEQLANNGGITKEEFEVKYGKLPEVGFTKEEIYAPTNKKGLIENIKEDISLRKENIQKAANREIEGKQTKAETFLQTAGQVAGGVGDVIGNALISGIKAITPDFVENAFGKAGEKFLKTNAGKSLANAGIKTVEAYQDWKEEHPRFAANLEGALNIADLVVDAATFGGKKAVEEGGEKAVKKALKETAEEGVEEASQKFTKKAIPDLMEELVEEGAEKTTKKSKIFDYSVSQISGLNPETIRTIVKDPDSFKKMSKELDREVLAKKVADTLDNRLKELSSLGAGYDAIRKSNKTVNVPVEQINNVLKKYGIGGVDDNGIFTIVVNKESAPLKSGDIKELQEFLDTFVSGEKTWSANATLNARQKLDQLAEWGTDKSNIATNISKELRKTIDDAIEDTLPEVKRLDAKYGPEKRLLTQIKKDILNNDGTLKDNAMSKIANLTGDAKKTILARIKQIDPDIESKVNIVKAVEDIERAKGLKVGTYTRGAAAGAGVLSGNIAGTIAGLIVTSPNVIVPLLEAYGKAKQIVPATIKKVIAELKNGKLSPSNNKIVRDMIDYMENALGSITRKETIRDVTEGNGGLVDINSITNLDENEFRSLLGE